jgi:hypothetical protein
MSIPGIAGLLAVIGAVGVVLVVTLGKAASASYMPRSSAWRSRA